MARILAAQQARALPLAFCHQSRIRRLCDATPHGAVHNPLSGPCSGCRYILANLLCTNFTVLYSTNVQTEHGLPRLDLMMECDTCSYTYGNTGEIWSKIFQNTHLLDACRLQQVFFSIIGQPPSRFSCGYLAMVIYNDHRRPFSRDFWASFMRSLRQPHHFERDDFVIAFPDLRLKLNIYNFLSSDQRRHIILSDPTLLIHDAYKSGFILTFTTLLSTYDEHRDDDRFPKVPGPIVRRSLAEGGGYEVEVIVNGLTRTLEIPY